MIALTVDICLILTTFWLGCTLWRLGSIAQRVAMTIEVFEEEEE